MAIIASFMASQVGRVGRRAGGHHDGLDNVTPTGGARQVHCVFWGSLREMQPKQAGDLLAARARALARLLLDQPPG